MRNFSYKLSSAFMYISAILIALVFLILESEVVFASSAINPQINLDGKPIEISSGQPAVIVSGRTLVPLRDVMVPLGYDISWDEESFTAYLSREVTRIAVTIGESRMMVNGSAVPLDVPATLIGGRTMLPLRAIGEATGFTVRWDGNRNLISIYTDPDSIEDIDSEEPASLSNAPRIAVDDSYFYDALFVGDSLVFGLHHYGIIPNATFVASTGINLSTLRQGTAVALSDGSHRSMQQAIASASEISKVYIMMGTNGINWLTHSSMYDSYRYLIAYIEETIPGVVIFIQGILPATYTYSESSQGFRAANVQGYNNGLKELAEELGHIYLDVHSVFAVDGYLRSDIAAQDGVHITVTGYRSWYEYLKANGIVIN